MAGADDHQAIYDRFRAEIERHTVEEALATQHWQQRCREIAADARRGNPLDFLRWPSLADFSVIESWVPPYCYDALRAASDWETKWRPLTRDSVVGTPRGFSRDFGTSPILIQHAYALKQYEDATGRSFFEAADVIVEFGGGYGSFCRLVRNAGFGGVYTIYDLPHVSSIQRLYLRLLGHEEVPVSAIGVENRSAFCLLDDGGLDELFEAVRSTGRRIGFIATWSLSEAPMAVRRRLFPRFHEICDAYLLAAQPGWETIDNSEYFMAFRDARPDLTWHRREVAPSFYLFA
jgi:hypothetical protein